MRSGEAGRRVANAGRAGREKARQAKAAVEQGDAGAAEVAVETDTGEGGQGQDVRGPAGGTRWLYVSGIGGCAFGGGAIFEAGSFPDELRGIEQLIADWPDTRDICFETNDDKQHIIRRLE
jgi:hypothetical protein